MFDDWYQFPTRWYFLDEKPFTETDIQVMIKERAQDFHREMARLHKIHRSMLHDVQQDYHRELARLHNLRTQSLNW